MPTAPWAIGDVMVMKEMTLRGQIALISGAAGDIGRAIALELASHGADIAISDVADHASEQCAEITALGRRCRYDRVDVTDAVAVSDWIARSEDELGTPTLIIPNAAVVTVANALTISATEWQRQLRVNLDGAFFIAQCAVQRLVAAKKSGRIVFIGSWAADRPHPNMPAYCAAKAGLRATMRCMALEFAPYNILINEIAPGYVDAGLSGKIFAQDAAIKLNAQQRVPIQRLITARDVARETAHLCDPLTDHLTGSVITMDGGLSLLSGDA